MTPSDQLAVDLRGVHKRYRSSKVYALRGVDMQVHRGEIFGLLGANGAGKSTLVKIMMTIIRPTRASGSLLGRPVGHKPTLQYVGYLPEHHRFPSYLRASEALSYYAALAKVPRPQRPGRIGGLLELVGMAEHARGKIGTFSKGMMQRIGLAQAMLNDPQLVVLDEPTDGVDPIGRRDIRNVLLELKRQGKTVFLNSHLLGEVEMICDRVAILHEGLVKQQGRIQDLTQAHQYYEIQIEIAPDGAAQAVSAALGCSLGPSAGVLFNGIANGSAPEVLAGRLADGMAIELDGASIRLGATDAQQVQGVIDALRRASLTIREMRPVRQSLEEFFIQTVQAQAAQASVPPPLPLASPAPQGEAR